MADKRKHAAWSAPLLVLSANVAEANESTPTEAPWWLTLIVNLLPIVVLVIALIFGLQQYAKWWAKHIDKHYTRHFEQINESLKRIADILEKK